MTNAASPLIFISYRNSDTSGETGRMVDHLKSVINPTYFFLDVENLGKGEFFPPLLKKYIDQCEVFIAVIGPTWGNFNVDVDTDPNDYVRMELAIALKKKKRILPVLVRQAKMPLPHQLPNDLKGFDQINAAELSHTRWQYDMDRIVETLKDFGIPLTKETARTERKTITWLIAGIAIILLLFVGLREFVFKNEEKKADVPTYKKEIPYLVAGTWKPLVPDRGTTIYKLSQTTKQVSLQVFERGVRTHTGYGTLNGSKLSLLIFDNGKSNRSLTLQLSTDNKSLIGTQALDIKGSNQKIGIPVTWQRVEE